MVKAGYIVVANNEIVAFTDVREMASAYNEYKEGIFKINMIDYKAYKRLRSAMPERLLVETDFKTPLTNEELKYVTNNMGDIDHIVNNMISEIDIIMDLVDEDDVRKLIKLSKILQNYSTPKKAFTNSGMSSTLKAYTFADKSQTNMIQQSNLLDSKIGEI